MIDFSDSIKYDSSTGFLTWAKPVGSKKAGDIAGSLGVKGYITVCFKGCRYKAHRLAWYLHYGSMPKGQIDHINGDRKDNRIENLRDVTSKINAMNRATRKRSKTKIAGVIWIKRAAKWRASIHVDGKKRFLKESVDFFDVCCVRKSAENKYGYHLNHGRSRPVKSAY
jgi:hypothetical protein